MATGEGVSLCDRFREYLGTRGGTQNAVCLLSESGGSHAFSALFGPATSSFPRDPARGPCPSPRVARIVHPGESRAPASARAFLPPTDGSRSDEGKGSRVQSAAKRMEKEASDYLASHGPPSPEARMPRLL